jgi:hypothetical protein
MWNRLLILLRLRTDWNNPVNAPPAFSCVPHEYRDNCGAGCCVDCGGGSAHSIHHGKRVPFTPVALDAEAAAAMKSAPAVHPLADF